MISFFIKTRNSFFRDAKRFKDIRPLSYYRRFDHFHANKLVMYVFSIAALLFAVRFGSLFFFLFTNFLGLSVAETIYPINPPSKSITAERIENKRLCVWVGIDKLGRFRYEGEYITLEVLDENLRRVKSWMPTAIICIVAYKDCEMGHLYDFYKILQKHNLRRIYLMTKGWKVNNNFY